MREKIIRILADTLGVPTANLGADASMETQPKWDSVAHLNFVMSIEQEFGVSFDPDEMIALGTLLAVEMALAKKGVA
jgi:acyl carrier protein